MLPARSSGKRTDAGAIPIPWPPTIKSITRRVRAFQAGRHGALDAQTFWPRDDDYGGAVILIIETKPEPALSAEPPHDGAVSARPMSRVDVESISIPEGHSALLTQDGGAILLPDGFILGIVDGSLVLMECKAATPDEGAAANV